MPRNQSSPDGKHESFRISPDPENKQANFTLGSIRSGPSRFPRGFSRVETSPFQARTRLNRPETSPDSNPPPKKTPDHHRVSRRGRGRILFNLHPGALGLTLHLLYRWRQSPVPAQIRQFSTSRAFLGTKGQAMVRPKLLNRTSPRPGRQELRGRRNGSCVTPVPPTTPRRRKSSPQGQRSWQLLPFSQS